MTCWVLAGIYTACVIGVWLVASAVTGLQPGWAALAVGVFLSYGFGFGNGRRQK